MSEKKGKHAMPHLKMSSVLATRELALARAEEAEGRLAMIQDRMRRFASLCRSAQEIASSPNVAATYGSLADLVEDVIQEPKP